MSLLARRGSERRPIARASVSGPLRWEMVFDPPVRAEAVAVYFRGELQRYEVWLWHQRTASERSQCLIMEAADVPALIATLQESLAEIEAAKQGGEP